MTDVVYLPVSIGEAMDKLSILDIKREKIVDQRVKEVEKEYEMLFTKLETIVSSYQKLYNDMKTINLIIWDQMNILRDSKTHDDTYLQLCIDCIDFNDIRFRIKNKINIASASSLKEQKSYRILSKTLILNAEVEVDTNLIHLLRAFSLAYDRITILSSSNDTIKVLRQEFSEDATVFFDNEIIDEKELVHLDPSFYDAVLEKEPLVKRLYSLGF